MRLRGGGYDVAEHVAAGLTMLPGAGVAVFIEEHPGSEGAQRRDGGVGEHDHGCVVRPPHGYRDRQRHVSLPVANTHVEAPAVVAHLLDAGDIVAVRTGRLVFPACNRKAAHQGDSAHSLDKLPLQFGHRLQIHRRSDARLGHQPADRERNRKRRHEGADSKPAFHICHGQKSDPASNRGPLLPAPRVYIS